MYIAPEMQFLFAHPRLKQWLLRPRGPRPNAIFPAVLESRPLPTRENYIFADDRRALNLTEALVKEYSREFPMDVRPNGFAGPTTVPGNWLALLSVSGCGMNPLPIPISNNAQLIKENKLRSSIDEKDKPWLKELVKLFFGHSTPADLHVRKEAGTGLPINLRGEESVQYKKLGALKALRNSDHFLSCVSGGKEGLETAREVYHVVLASMIHERQQPSSGTLVNGVPTPKSRIAPTEEEARSGNYLGQTLADMRVFDQAGEVIEGHWAMRRRDVFGGCGIANYFLTAIFGCFRSVYLNRFAFTYKTRDRLDKEEKIRRFKYVVGSDVKTMDKMVPRWFLDEVLSELTNYLDPRVVELMRRMYQAPYIAPSPWIETPKDYNPVFGGSPLDPGSFTQHVGLPSGVAFNPDWGKLWMTFVYAILYRDVGALYSPGELEPMLRGKHHDIALLDASDDAAMLTNSAAVMQRLLKPSSPYAVLEVETPVVFLGDVFCEIDGEKKVYPNPLTYVVNVIAREDSVTSKDVNTWADGVMARQQVYSANPIFRDLFAVFRANCRQHLGYDPFLIAQSMARQHKFEDADAMVIDDPATLHYKVDPADVSPETLNRVVATVPAADFYTHIEHLFRGVKVDSVEAIH